jgi:hypothetical protein
LITDRPGGVISSDRGAVVRPPGRATIPLDKGRSTVAMAFPALAVRAWREQRPDAAERAWPQALAAAVTVAEIQRRLRREAARPAARAGSVFVRVHELSEVARSKEGGICD